MTAKQLITEIKISLTVNSVIRVLLKTIILFLMMILLYNALNVPKIIVATPLTYLGVALYIELRKDKVKLLEERAPKLKEKLRTVIDIFDVETDIAKDLKKGVLKDLKDVKVSEFIEQKKIFTDFLVIVVLAIIITIMMPYKIDNKFFDFKSEINPTDNEQYRSSFANVDNTKKEEESSASKGDKAGRNRFTTIFGNKTVLKTGEDEIGIQLEGKTAIAKNENTLKNINEHNLLDATFGKNKDNSAAKVYVQESDEEKKRIIESFYEKRAS